MLPKISFFPVGNGDMTLIELESGRKILIDINIRVAADDPNDETLDVAEMLRKRLKRDSNGRPYVDVMLLSHPDEDHCRGLAKHFHLGVPEEWSEKTNKIFIRELWSSPMVFRRASKNYTLCDDAKAFNKEAKRRVKKFREECDVIDGERILILGEDENGKTDDLEDILVRVDETFSQINGQHDWSISARLLAPLPKDDDEQEEKLSKNKSSTIIQFSISEEQCFFLTGGDAEVEIWEKLWQRHQYRADWLSYDILLAPHHCSWRSLSYDSWSDKGKNAEVCKDARRALAQAKTGATVVSSSKPVKAEDSDPPCIRAKCEYEDITSTKRGSFKCVGDSSDIMEFEITRYGPCLKRKTAATVVGSGSIGKQPLAHG